MLNFLKELFGSKPKVDFATLVKNGATIIDVRTTGEYNAGHVPGSINFPLDTLQEHLNEINGGKPVILCCASGARSRMARSILVSLGFNEVYNAGSWRSLMVG
jgi:rhodanese-related sulfurtransferase